MTRGPSHHLGARVAAVLAAVAVLCPVVSSRATAAEKKPATLDDYFAPPDPAVQNAEQRKAEDAVARCMKAQGFDYVPVDPASGARITMRIGSSSSADPADLRKHGYGIAEGLDTMQKLGKVSSVAPDPNAAIVDKLSPADKRAYQIAMFGKEMAQALTAAAPVGGAGAGKPVSIKIGKMGGCRGEAQPDDDARVAAITALQPKLTDLRRRFEADKRIITVRQQWQTCMAKAGYDYRDRDAIITDLEGRANAITGFGLPASKGGTGEVATGRVVIGRPRGNAPSFDPAKINGLRTLEQQIASADADCTEPIASTLRTVRAEYEAKFIADNEAALDKVR